MKLGVIIAAILGLALATALIGLTGFRPVIGAVAAIGWPGFVVFVLYWLVVIAILGLAWFMVAPGLKPRRLVSFAWGRLLREAATDVLPFSQIGGLVIGARGVIARGVDETVVFASTIVDLTTELVAQLAYTLMAIGLLAWRLSSHPQGSGVLSAAIGGLLVALAATAGFVAMQRRGIGPMINWLGARLLPQTITRAEAVRARLDDIYRRPGRLMAAIATHGLGWVASGVGSWIALEFMQADVPLWAVLAIEGLLYAVRSFAFFVPGALGVQEGAYALIGPLFGLQVQDALALSLLKRGRDLAIGVPTLIVWQAMEGRRLLARR